jgi:glycosyltransferase involved in cell wall biosynthesis
MFPSPVVSVLCTVYNAERFLALTIESVLSQTLQQWEMIIVDDGSTDQSKRIAQSYDDPRIQLIELPLNVGRTKALNYGLKQCNGKYVAILDADDLARPERLLRQVEFLEQNLDYGAAASWCTVISETSQEVSRYRPVLSSSEIYQYLSWCDPLVHSSIMWRHQLLDHLGGYIAPSGLEDHYLLLQVAQISQIGIIGEDLTAYRHVDSSLSHSKGGLIRRLTDQLVVLRTASEMPELQKSSKRRNRRAISLTLLRLGGAQMRSGAITKGFLRLMRGLLLDPTISFYPFRTKSWESRWHPQRRFSV